MELLLDVYRRLIKTRSKLQIVQIKVIASSTNLRRQGFDSTITWRSDVIARRSGKAVYPGFEDNPRWRHRRVPRFIYYPRAAAAPHMRRFNDASCIANLSGLATVRGSGEVVYTGSVTTPVLRLALPKYAGDLPRTVEPITPTLSSHPNEP